MICSRLIRRFHFASAMLFLLMIPFGSAVAEQPSSEPGILCEGLRIVSAGGAEARALGIESPLGAAVFSLAAESPFTKAGVRRGDLIVSLGGQEISNADEFQSAVRSRTGGMSLSVAIVRNQERRELTVELSSTSSPPSTRWYLHPQGTYRLRIPNGWRLESLPQEEYVAENRFDLLESGDKQYRLFCFRESWLVPESDRGLAGWLERHLAKHPEASGLDFKLGSLPATYLTYQDAGTALYRVGFLHERRRYVINFRAPVLSDVGGMPRTLAEILATFEIVAAPKTSTDPGVSIANGTTTPVTVPNGPAGDLPASPTSATAEWNRRIIGDLTISLPPDWIASQYTAGDEGHWYVGDALLPDASFSLRRDASREELFRGGTVVGKSQRGEGLDEVDIYTLDVSLGTRSERGIVVVYRRPAADGSTPTLSGFASSDRWNTYGPTFDRMLSAVRRAPLQR
jgi:hypothetical protein